MSLHPSVPMGMTAKQARAYLERQNREWPSRPVAVPRDRWPVVEPGLIEVFRSNRFLLQVYTVRQGVLRLSVNRTQLAPGGERWEEGITWDELQGLKHDIGYGDWYGVEVYPRDRDLVNVANLRHIWLLKEPLEIGRFSGAHSEDNGE